jgi:HlyD family secretion protein
MSAEYKPIPAADRARRSGGRTSPWMKWLLLLLAIAVLWMAFGQALVERVTDAGKPVVKTARVEQRSAGQVAAAVGASSNGYIVAKKRAALSADTPGRIVEMNVEEGSVVKEGQVVARLYSDEYAANLRRAQADVATAQASADRATRDLAAARAAVETVKSTVRPLQEDLTQSRAAWALAQTLRDRAQQTLSTGVGTLDALQRAQGEVDVAAARVAAAKAREASARAGVTEAEARVASFEAALHEANRRIESLVAARDLAQATLDKTMVKAPFDGVVVLKDAEVGEVVSPNVVGGTSARGSVVTMVDFASLEVQAEVPETSLSNVLEGAQAQIYLDAYPDKAYAGKVDRIWPTANRTKATVEVRVAFMERDDKLRPEMGARIVFAPKEAAAAPANEARILIPVEALVEREGSTFVWVVDGLIAKKRAIELGDKRAGKVAVRSGLSAGETIVVSAPSDLQDGAAVRVEGK